MFLTRDGIVVYGRNDWGARDPARPYDPVGDIQSVVVHHGGPEGPPRMSKETAILTCRRWQNFHMNQRGWNDIGYHLMMDGLGRLYLGRPATALGAHVEGQNTNRVGIVLMQDGRSHPMTAGQKRTMRRLFRHPHRRLGLPALKTLVRHPGERWGVFGHGEVPGQATECPGGRILADLHRIVKEMA